MTRKYHPHIVVHMTQDEKDEIDKLAKQHGLSTSSFVKSQLTYLLSADESTTDVPFDYDMGSRDLRISVHVSEREFATIKEKAGAKTIAAYVRDAALNGSKVLKVEVYDDDIMDLIHIIQPQIETLFHVITALQLQHQLQPAQYNRMESLLENISDDIRKIVSYTHKNRNSIRQTRLRELRKRCDTAIKTEKDSLASFAENE